MRQIPDVVILSGGFGLRLREMVGDVPKPMAPIAGRPFLELLLKQLKRHGFSRVILSVGYKAEVIQEHFGNHACGLELVYSIETSPLGTGGALREAAGHIHTQTALVMNGDSYTDVDLSRLIREHEAKKADVTVVVIPENRADAGSVVLDGSGRVKAFAEKRQVPESRYLSAGIYGVEKSLVATIAQGSKISLEEHLFPQWLAEDKRIEGFVYAGRCLDIGTPERFLKAQRDLENVESETVIESEDRS